MKKRILNFSIVLALSFLMTSCFTYTYSVGDGPQTGVEVVEKNHYLIYGLAPIKTSDPIQMAGDATDYEVTITHTFVDGLINAITFGLYTPTTTKVRR
ncbi:MAG: Bor family protein [Bacteroidota bacterium]